MIVWVAVWLVGLSLMVVGGAPGWLLLPAAYMPLGWLVATSGLLGALWRLVTLRGVEGDWWGAVGLVATGMAIGYGSVVFGLWVSSPEPPDWIGTMSALIGVFGLQGWVFGFVALVCAVQIKGPLPPAPEPPQPPAPEPGAHLPAWRAWDMED